MRGVAGRSLSVVLVASLGAAGLPLAAVAEEGCPPEPPYGTFACILDFAWDEPVKVAYGVGTEIGELSHAIPRVDSLRGDSAATEGGCGGPVERILITRRIQALEAVNPWDQAESGVGTHTFECGAGVDWAAMRPSNETPGEPWVYAIMATGTEPCEGHYTDTFDEWGNLLSRDQPESATVTATITCYRPGETEPSGTQHEVIGAVSVLNFAEWEKWRWSQYSDDPYPYRRPLPMVLGELTLPPVGSGSEAEATVVQLAVEPAPEPAAAEEGTSDETGSTRTSRSQRNTRAARVFLGMLFLTAIRAAEKVPRQARPFVQVTPAEIAAAALLQLFDDADDAAASSPEDGSDVAVGADGTKGPAKPPPDMKPKHEQQGRVWVALPTKATVHDLNSDGQKRTLKAGVWYQMISRDDGTRDFYNKKGRRIGTSPPADVDKVEVQTHDEWSDARDAHAATAAEHVLDWLIEDPPPTSPAPASPEGETDVEPMLISVKRAVPIIPEESLQAGLDPPPHAYATLDPDEPAWYWGASDERGGMFLFDASGKMLGRIHPSHNHSLYLRRHEVEATSTDG